MSSTVRNRETPIGLVCRERETCRVSGSRNLELVLDLGVRALTGVFPSSREEDVPAGPLQLVRCPDSGLVQLRHSYLPQLMYGENYGYRSGLNRAMVRHLQAKVAVLGRRGCVQPGDTVVDIGSNDSTLLRAWNVPGLRRIGVDPTGEKFRNFYPEDIELMPDFFTRERLIAGVGDVTARIVTSIAMFYDLEDPVAFARDVHSILADDGLWHLEQSYLPSMVRRNSYDTICHEHVEYYSLKTLEATLSAAGFVIIDVELNDINGGSFAVTAAKSGSSFQPNRVVIDWLREQEQRAGFDTAQPFEAFATRVRRLREDLRSLISALVASGKRVIGYGASTKGNVLLQYCSFGPEEIPCIAEVNEDKFGRFTPGTGIPIVSEAEARSMQPDYFLVLPWHFKPEIVKREQEFLAGGGHMIFPFPEVEVV